MFAGAQRRGPGYAGDAVARQVATVARRRDTLGVDARDDGQRLEDTLAAALGLVDVVVVLIAHQAAAHRHPAAAGGDARSSLLRTEEKGRWLRFIIFIQ